MRILLTPEEIAAGDLAADYAEGHWKWFLGIGIASVVFGFVVLSFKIETLWALAVFTGIYFIAVGVTQIVGAFGARRWRWLYILAGMLGLAAGVISLVWPEVTLFVIAILIGWVLLFWGVADIITSLMSRHVSYWWLYLIRGGISVVLGVWALAQPKATLVVFVTVLGLWAIIFGIFEVFAAFEMRYARRNWEAAKTEVLA